MKLSDFAPQSSELVLIHPTQLIPFQHNGEDVSLTIVGTHSDEYQNAIKAMSSEISECDDQIKMVKIFDDVYRQCVIGWSHDEWFESEYSEDNFKDIWKKYFFIRELVKGVIADDQRFFRKIDEAGTDTSDREAETGHSKSTGSNKTSGPDSDRKTNKKKKSPVKESD